MSAYYLVTFPWWARLLQRVARRLEKVAARTAVHYTPDGRRVRTPFDWGRK